MNPTVRIRVPMCFYGNYENPHKDLAKFLQNWPLPTLFSRLDITPPDLIVDKRQFMSAPGIYLFRFVGETWVLDQNGECNVYCLNPSAWPHSARQYRLLDVVAEDR